MLVVIGYIVILGAVFGGFAMAGGHLGSLVQPVELLMIFGSGAGAFLVANPNKVIKATVKAFPSLLRGSQFNKALYIEMLSLLFDILSKVRKEGLMSVEGDVDEPDQSPIFTKYPRIIADHHIVEFLTDYLRLMVGGNMNAFEIENLMDNEIETHHAEGEVPVNAIAKMADAGGPMNTRPAAAQALAKHEGELFLNGLTTLSEAAAESLGKHQGDLFLSGLTSISDQVGNALAKSKNGLALDSLKRLTNYSALMLATNLKWISLNSLDNLSESDGHLALANLISKDPTEIVYLNGLKSLSDSTAEALSKYKGEFELNGLTSLSDTAITVLAKHEGHLSLNGLATLSDAAAEALANHAGGLSLDGLTSLSDTTAEALAGIEGYLGLSGLTNMSVDLANKLANHNGSLSLDGLKSLSDTVAKSLAKHQGDLSFGGLENLDATAAKNLVHHKDFIWFSGLKCLSNLSSIYLAKKIETIRPIWISDYLKKFDVSGSGNDSWSNYEEEGNTVEDE